MVDVTGVDHLSLGGIVPVRGYLWVLSFQSMACLP